MGVTISAAVLREALISSGVSSGPAGLAAATIALVSGHAIRLATNDFGTKKMMNDGRNAVREILNKEYEQNKKNEKAE